MHEVAGSAEEIVGPGWGGELGPGGVGWGGLC